jgi:Predicted amidohydrolase
MKSYIAAAISMTSVPDLAKNLSQAEELIELAIRQGAELVTLPENFPFLGGEEEKYLKQKRSPQQVKNFSKQLLKNIKSQF